MSKSLPPLTWLRSFEAAARTLSFTAAAEEIGLTQSAVSQQVKSLELRLGVPLFARKPRSLALTDDGRKLLPQVGAALSALAQATEPFDRGIGPGVLTVATSVSVAQWLIAPRLPEFTRAHPNIRIRLISAVWPDDFHSSQADVEVRFGSQVQVGKNAVALHPNRLVPLKSPALLGDASQLTLIETVGTSSGWAAWQKEHGPVGQPSFYVDTYGLAMQLSVDGNGVCLVSEVLAKPALESGRLVPAFPGAITGSEGYYLSANPTLPAALTFAKWLEGCVSG